MRGYTVDKESLAQRRHFGLSLSSDYSGPVGVTAGPLREVEGHVARRLADRPVTATRKGPLILGRIYPAGWQHIDPARSGGRMAMQGRLTNNPSRRGLGHLNWGVRR